MKLDGQVALVTGANRGLGRAIARELRLRGVEVYAGARDPGSITDADVIPLEIDITDPASVQRAAQRAGDLTLVVNNAGSSTGSDPISGSPEDIRLEMETHYFGSLAVARAFAPALGANGGGALVNILSVLSWLTFPGVGAYSAAKAAEWALTNALRIELAAQGTLVTGLHVGYMDTDMTRGVDAPKLDPAAVARILADGLEADEVEILADDLSRQVRQGLAGGVAALYPAS